MAVIYSPKCSECLMELRPHPSWGLACSNPLCDLQGKPQVGGKPKDPEVAEWEQWSAMVANMAREDYDPTVAKATIQMLVERGRSRQRFWRIQYEWRYGGDRWTVEVAYTDMHPIEFMALVQRLHPYVTEKRIVHTIELTEPEWQEFVLSREDEVAMFMAEKFA